MEFGILEFGIRSSELWNLELTLVFDTSVGTSENFAKTLTTNKVRNSDSICNPHVVSPVKRVFFRILCKKLVPRRINLNEHQITVLVI